MRAEISECIRQSLEALREQGIAVEEMEPQVTQTKDEAHGDFASNAALLLAKSCGLPSRELAQKIVDNLPPRDSIQKVEIAGPGFINFYVAASASSGIVEAIFNADGQFGHRPHTDTARSDRTADCDGADHRPHADTAPQEFRRHYRSHDHRPHTDTARSDRTADRDGADHRPRADTARSDRATDRDGADHRPCADTAPARVLVEYVSANPTGPLHVGHGRSAAYGASIAALMTAAGMEVDSEYYVNDVGRQMDILALSVWLRYLDLGAAKQTVAFPPNAYQGDYVWDIAAAVRNRHGDEMDLDAAALFAGIDAEDEEKAMDAMVQKCRETLGGSYIKIKSAAADTVLADIKHDLETMNVHYSRWFSEESLFDNGQVQAVIDKLQKDGFLYEEQGALWFRSSSFGDDKDRVMRRDNGQFTYFASDVAYHYDKYQRGYDRIINIWGSDHHGYIPRVKAAIKALGFDADKLTIVLVQFANLYRAGKRVPMSTRGGQFVPLRELYQEVGVDAARFFYVMRRPSQHMDFDLDLAKSQTNENPVYYVQYVHARICSVFRQLEERGLRFDPAAAKPELLTEPEETELTRLMEQYQEMLLKAADEYKPHLLLNHLRDLSTKFHAYYNSCQFLVDDGVIRNTRLMLLSSVRLLIADGLNLIGVSAPERM